MSLFAKYSDWIIKILPILGILVLVNSGLFVTPYLVRPSFGLSEDTNRVVYDTEQYRDFDTSDDLIYSMQDTVLVTYDKSGQEQWRYDVKSEINLVNPDENDILLVETTKQGAYITYVRNATDKFIYTLALVNEDGISQSWDIRTKPVERESFTQRGEEIIQLYDRFTYAIAMNTDTDNDIFILKDVKATAAIETQHSKIYYCEIIIFEIDKAIKQLQEYEITGDDYFICEYSKFPETFVIENKLQISFRNGENSYKRLQYDDTTDSFEELTPINNRFEELMEEDEKYDPLGFFVANDQIYYVLGWNLGIRPEENVNSKLLYIYNNEGAVAVGNLTHILPEDAANTGNHFFLRMIYENGYRNYRLTKLQVIQQSHSQFILGMSIQVTGFYPTYLLKFDISANSENRLEIKMMKENKDEDNETIEIMLGMKKLDNTIVFNNVELSQNQEFTLNWKQITAENIPAKIEQSSPWLKYGLTSLIISILGTGLLWVRYRNKGGASLYPQKDQ